MKKLKKEMGINRKSFKRKAEITSSEFITLVILILGVIIVLFFYKSINWQGTITQEVCHNSILERHTLNLGSKDTGGNILPLKCKTEKVCFVKSGIINSFTENCEAFANEKDVIKIKVKDKEELIKEINLKLTEYWATMGEGYLDYQPKEGWAIETFYCSSWARFAFSKKVQDEIAKEIMYKELYTAMQNTKVEGKEISQLYYMYRLSNFEQLRMMLLEGEFKGENEKIVTDISAYKIDTSEQYAIISMMNKQGRLFELLGAGTGGVLGTVLAAKTGFSATFLVSAGATSGAYLVSYYTSRETKFAPPFFWPYDSDSMKSLRCDVYDFIQ